MLYSIKRIYKKTRLESQVEKPGFFDVHFIAKKKIFKRSVERNKVKRRARHAFHDAIKQLPSEAKERLSSLKQVIFFLERDMIQESYSTIIEMIKKDLIKN